MQGRNLHKKYVDIMAGMGAVITDWEDLPPLIRQAWDAMAESVEEKGSPATGAEELVHGPAREK